MPATSSPATAWPTATPAQRGHMIDFLDRLIRDLDIPVLNLPGDS